VTTALHQTQTLFIQTDTLTVFHATQPHKDNQQCN
jgi:hypothetical protein